MTFPYGALDVGRQTGRLFQWEAADLSLTARTGQVGVFARNDTQSVGVIDSNGVYGPALPNQPRFIAIDTDGDGVRDAVALLLEPATTNLVKQNCTVATTPWVNVSGTLPTNAALTAAGLSWCLFANANTSAIRQPITFASDGGKAYSFRIKAFPGATGTVFVLPVWDDTSAVARAVVQATVAADGTMTFSSTGVGTIISAVKIASGGYEVKGQSASVTHAHSHFIYANDNSGFGGTATAFYGTGFQVEDALIPTSLIVTTTTTGSRLGETLTFTVTAPPQVSTLYVKHIERGNLITGATPGLIGIGASTTPALFIFNSGGVYAVEHLNSSTAVSSAVGTPSFGQLNEVRAALFADGSVQLGQSIAGATETLGTQSAGFTASQVNPIASAWHDATLTLSDRGGVPGYAALLSVRWGAAVQAMSAMRATA